MSSPRTLLRRARRLTIDLVASVFPGVDKRPLEDRVEWRDGTRIRRVTDEAEIRKIHQALERNHEAPAEGWARELPPEFADHLRARETGTMKRPERRSWRRSRRPPSPPTG